MVLLDAVAGHKHCGRCSFLSGHTCAGWYFTNWEKLIFGEDSEASAKSWWSAKRCLTRMSQLLPAFLDTSFLSGRGWALDSMNTTALFWDCWQWDSYLLCRGLAGYSYSVHLKVSAAGCYWLLTTGRQCLAFWTASCSNLSVYFGPFC